MALQTAINCSGKKSGGMSVVDTKANTVTRIGEEAKRSIYGNPRQDNDGDGDEEVDFDAPKKQSYWERFG